MKRGDIWTLRDDRFATKARPVVVVSSDLPEFSSVTVCMFTTTPRNDTNLRPEIIPNNENGLTKKSFVMIDKIATIRENELGSHLGCLASNQMREISKSIAKVLGITVSDLV